MTHFIAAREQLHSNLLGLHVQAGNWLNDASLRQLTAGLYAKSSGLPAAAGRAVGLIGARVRLQAYTQTFIDGFHLVAWACVAALLLIALPGNPLLNYGELGFPSGAPRPRWGQNMNRRATLLCILFVLVRAELLFAQETKLVTPRRITLEEAVQLALKHNHVVRISTLKVEEKEHTKDIARSAYFPILRNDSNLNR